MFQGLTTRGFRELEQRRSEVGMDRVETGGSKRVVETWEGSDSEV